MSIPIIALPHLLEDGGFGKAMLFGSFRVSGGTIRALGLAAVGGRDSLAEAAVATDFGRGVEEDLNLSVREDGSPDVAAFHDHASSRTQGPLLEDHPCTEIGVYGYLRGGGGDILLADAAGDVGSIEQDAIAIDLGLEGDSGAVGELEQRRFLVEGEVVLDSLQGQSAIHCASLKVEKAEAAGEMSSQGALAGASRAVDGDDGTLTFGTRLRHSISFSSS